MPTHADDLIKEIAQATGVPEADVVRAARKRKREIDSVAADCDRVLNDPHAWFTEVITPPEYQRRVGALQHEMIDFITDKKWMWKLMLVPRETVKSHTITIGEDLRSAVKDPNMRIMIDHGVRDKSALFLGAIKGKLASAQVQALFGNLLPTSSNRQHRNNAFQLDLLTRTDTSIKEATFTASGCGVSEAGNHFDRIVADDLVCEDNSGEFATPESLESPIRRFEAYVDLLDKEHGELWCIGTRWNPLDCWQHIIDTFCDPHCKTDDGQFLSHAPNCTCDFDVSVRELKEDGEYIYPEIWTAEKEARTLRAKGPYGFSCHYLNNPTDPINSWFNPSSIEACLYDDEQFAEEFDRPIGEHYRECNWYLAVDPAESKKKGSSSTAVVSVAQDATGMWWVDQAVKKKADTGEFVDLCIRQHKLISTQYDRVGMFGMEQNTRKSLAYALRVRMTQLDYHFGIRDLAPDTQGGPEAKERHIKRIQILFQFNKIRIHRRCRDLIRLLKNLPATKFRDLADALAYVMDMTPPIEQNTGDEIDLPDFAEEQFEGTGY
jgi:hypothetical protein